LKVEPMAIAPEKRPLRLPEHSMLEGVAAKYIGLPTCEAGLTEFRKLKIPPTGRMGDKGRGRALWSAKDLLDGLPEDWPHDINPPNQYRRIERCDPAEIYVPSTSRRPVNFEKVEGLAASMRQVGLQHPITVRESSENVPTDPNDEGCYQFPFELVAGAHRLLAAKSLGWTSVDIAVVDGDEDVVRLIEIDENLARSELTPSQRADHIARRKEVFERIHGSAKAKGAHAANEVQGNQHDANAKLADAFTTDTAKATGMSERSVQRDAQRGETIGSETLNKITGTSLDKGAELDALAKLEKDQQTELIERAAKGEKVTARKATKPAKTKQTAKKSVAGKSPEAVAIEEQQLRNVEQSADFYTGWAVEDQREAEEYERGVQEMMEEWARSKVKQLFEAASEDQKKGFIGELETSLVRAKPH
jgi:ParB/RepB/Spo0J family partition protein